MKPAPFDYYAPENVAEAVALLQAYGDDAKILAGGQSLMPLMNLRLARPRVIIDINRLAELDFIDIDANETLVIGALTRQRAVERSTVAREQNPPLAAAVRLIGHFQIRNRGTVGGSIAHADPAAELPAVCVLLDAELSLKSQSGLRTIAAEEFFLGYLTTAIEPIELLTEIRIPPWRRGEGWAIEEISRRKGDFAIVGVALRVKLDESDRIESAGVVAFGAAGRPQRLARSQAALQGREADHGAAEELRKIIAAELEPDSDVHAAAEYRKEAGGVLGYRALETALARARGTVRH
jgi:carbon-monoxide dehydrogenase medium subunit